ncbi:MAG: DUF3048 domain-containing protein, partial [Eubacterium sp.]|nr:DUF3048 domain-containing protein [Eubacterium sp.]
MNSNQKKIVISVCIVAVILLGVMVFLMMNMGKNKEVAPAPVQTAVASATETPVPTATPDPHEGLVQSSINGSWVKPSVENKRPFAVMINNIQYAFAHQKGVSKADIVYEALAEGGITRMLAVFQDIKKAKNLGSVRSARHYYVQFAYEWDAIFCHFGHTKYAVAKMNKLGTNNISGLSAIGPVAYARNSFVAPHNVFTNGKKLTKAAKKLKYKLKKRKNRTAEHFGFNEVDTDLTSGSKAKKIVLPFSYYSTVKLKYNKKKKTYMKFEYGKKHKDMTNGKQLSFKNVIVQFVKESNKDHNGYQTMELNTTGKGYYLTNGKKIPITWTRKES